MSEYHLRWDRKADSVRPACWRTERQTLRNTLSVPAKPSLTLSSLLLLLLLLLLLQQLLLLLLLVPPLANVVTGVGVGVGVGVAATSAAAVTATTAATDPPTSSIVATRAANALISLKLHDG